MLRKRRAEGFCHRIGGRRERFGRVAPGDVPGCAEVPAAVYLWRIRFHRFCDRGNGLQNIILNPDLFLRRLQDFFRFGNNQADCVAYAACNIPGRDHHIPILDYMPYLVVRYVRRCQNADYAFHRQRLRSVDGQHTRPGIF